MRAGVIIHSPLRRPKQHSRQRSPRSGAAPRVLLVQRKLRLTALFLVILPLALFSVFIGLAPLTPDSHAWTNVAAFPEPSVAFAQLPLIFEPNIGQTDPRVRFLSRGLGYSLFLTPKEAVMV